MVDNLGDEFLEFEDIDSDGDVEDPKNGFFETKTYLKWDYYVMKSGKIPTFCTFQCLQSSPRNVRGPTFIFNNISTFMTLFHFFWTSTILNAIVVESWKPIGTLSQH